MSAQPARSIATRLKESAVLTAAQSGSLSLFVSGMFPRNRKNRPWFSVNQKLLRDQHDIFRIHYLRYPALSPSRGRLAFANKDLLQVWDTSGPSLLTMFPLPPIPEKTLNSAGCISLAIRDIKWIGESHIAIAYVDGMVQVFDVTGKTLLSEKIGGCVQTIGVSPDGRYFAATTFPGEEKNYASCCTMLYDCELLVKSNILRPVRRIRAFDELYSLPNVLRFHTDGQSLIASSGRNMDNGKISSRIEVFNLITGKTRVLMEEEGKWFPPQISNIATDGRYCITTSTGVLVIDRSHTIGKTLLFSEPATSYPSIAVSIDGKDLFLKPPAKPGVDRARLDEDNALHSEMANLGFFYMAPIQPGMALALVYHGTVEPVIVDTRRGEIVRRVPPSVQTYPSWDITSKGDLLTGDNEGTLRHYDGDLQLVKTIRSAYGNLYSIKSSPSAEEAVAVGHGGAVMTYRPLRDSGATAMPVYTGYSSGKPVLNGSGYNFARYTPQSLPCPLLMSARDMVWVNDKRMFRHAYGKLIQIDELIPCTYPACSGCRTCDTKDEVFTDEPVNGMVFMHGYILCLLSTRLIAVHPYDYHLRAEPDKSNRFIEDQKTVMVLMANLSKCSNCCSVGPDRLAIVTEEKAMVVRITPEFRVRRIKTIPCPTGYGIRYDNIHHRIIIKRRAFFSIYTDDLRHIADLYLLRNGRHCIHVTPKSLYFKDSSTDHPGYLWGSGDCSELFSVTDDSGNPETSPDEKLKIVQTYYNRSKILSALSGNPDVQNPTADQEINSFNPGQRLPEMLEYRMK